MIEDAGLTKRILKETADAKGAFLLFTSATMFVLTHFLKVGTGYSSDCRILIFLDLAAEAHATHIDR